MKKSILILLTSILLTGCSVDKNQDKAYLIEDEKAKENYVGTYVREETKQVIEELNDMKLEYTNSGKFYIDMEELASDDILNPSLNIYMSEETMGRKNMEEVVDKLDVTMAKGLKKEFDRIKDDKSPVENNKFDKVLIGKSKDGNIFLDLEIIDIKDGKVKKIYEDMTGNDYLLSKLINVGDRKYIEFESPTMVDSGKIIIIYGVTLKNYEVEKVNIFTNSFDGLAASQFDKDELLKVLGYLNLENKGPIVDHFNKIGENKNGKKKYKSGDYKVNIIKLDGKTYNGINEDYERGYISIEKI